MKKSRASGKMTTFLPFCPLKSNMCIKTKICLSSTPPTSSWGGEIKAGQFTASGGNLTSGVKI